jgi:transposase-like protein
MVDTLIRHIIMGLIIWQVVCCYQYRALAKASLERLQRQRARQGRRKQAKVFKGLTNKPVCEQCEAEGSNHPSPGREPPPRLEPKRGRRRCVQTGHHYCPYQDCRYYGWLGLGNISSNGHPNGGRNRQLYCCVCERYFAETKGTLFYGKRYRPQDIEPALTALAEGLGIRAVGRVFKVEPDTVLDWLLDAGTHMEAFTDYLVRELAVAQVQLDELFGLIRAVAQGQIERQEAIEQLDRPWLWAAMDPVSKFWLATELGSRTTALAQRLVHQVVKRLKVDQVPLFMTDGCGA